jgi:diaminobutyrate-2-oxoglutarate transaminase
MNVFETLESEVRGYCRSFPVVFERASGCRVWDEQGNAYLDFFGGAGALNYGHNNPAMKRAVIEYIATNGITHSLDMHTVAKRRFLETFRDVVLRPRGLDYKVQFPGPTGTNAVEAALKLARKVTGRQLVISFTNAFHGMTLGSLAVTGNGFKRGGAGVTLTDATSMPYDGYLGEGGESLAFLNAFLDDRGSGLDLPAAVIVETVQAEGGINVASLEWLRGLEAACRSHDILLIVDDVQAGCGRTGPFFSFEPAGISPDIVCLSKSIGGMGLPLALTLIRPQHDVWEPGEHNGTFRGNNLAFVAATEALEYWRDDGFEREIEAKGELLADRLEDLRREFAHLFVDTRGRGLIRGLQCAEPAVAGEVCAAAFANGLLMETSGVNGEVIKCLPPLVVSEEEIEEGVGLLRRSIAAAASPKAAA